MSGPSLSEAQWISKIYANLNEKEQALTWLERVLGTGAIGFFYENELVWDSIRGANLDSKRSSPLSHPSNPTTDYPARLRRNRGLSGWRGFI